MIDSSTSQKWHPKFREKLKYNFVKILTKLNYANSLLKAFSLNGKGKKPYDFHLRLNTYICKGGPKHWMTLSLREKGYKKYQQ